jgi:hypothetical protein
MRYTAEILLQQWGLWQRQGGLGLSYRSPLGAMMDRQMQSAGPSKPWIDEEEIERCDRIVTRLGMTDRLCADTVIAYYCTNRTQHGVGVALSINRQRVSELLNCGRMYIQSEIDARAAA